MISVSSPSALYILAITIEENLQQLNHDLKQWLRLIPSDRTIVVAGISKSNSSVGQSLFSDLVKSAVSEFPNIKQEVTKNNINHVEKSYSSQHLDHR